MENSELLIKVYEMMLEVEKNQGDMRANIKVLMDRDKNKAYKAEVSINRRLIYMILIGLIGISIDAIAK